MEPYQPMTEGRIETRKLLTLPCDLKVRKDPILKNVKRRRYQRHKISNNNFHSPFEEKQRSSPLLDKQCVPKTKGTIYVHHKINNGVQKTDHKPLEDYLRRLAFQ